MLEFNDRRLARPNANDPILGRVIVPRLAVLDTDEAKTMAVRHTTALYGELAEIYDHKDGFAHVRLKDDHYAGWVRANHLGEPGKAPTHRVIAPMTYAFSEPHVKAAPKTTLFLNSLVTVGEVDGTWIKCGAAGWLPDIHLLPLDEVGADPAKVATGLFGAPYLWGGNDAFGLDCSGLVQTAYKACGLQLPRDSDMQFHWCGEHVTDWQSGGALQRNDLVFWRGHVGIMLDSETLMHANGYYMSTIHEPLADALQRIEETYGPAIGAKRIALDGSNCANWKKSQAT